MSDAQAKGNVVDILGISAQPGERAFGYVDVTGLATGCRLRVPVHVVAGAQPGPTLLVTSGAHGDEIATILTVRDLLDRVSPKELTGTLVAVPVCNLPAFETQTAFTRLDDWSLDESFPATSTPMVAWARGWATQQLASALARLVDLADAVVDLRAGNHHIAARCVSVNAASAAEPTEYVAKSLRLAQAFGFADVVCAPAADSSLPFYAAMVQVPLITAELGGGHPYNAATMAAGLQGIQNVMQQLGMIGGAPVASGAVTVLTDHRLLRTKHGGMFYPEIGEEALGTTAPQGTLLGRVVHAQSLAELEEITAPFEQTRVLTVRALFSTVHPGDSAYLVAEVAGGK